MERNAAMTTLSIKTKAVTLKDGTRVVINAVDFDPALHFEASRKPVTKKRKPRSK